MYSIDLLRQLCLRTDMPEQLVKSSDHDFAIEIIQTFLKKSEIRYNGLAKIVVQELKNQDKCSEKK